MDIDARGPLKLVACGQPRDESDVSASVTYRNPQIRSQLAHLFNAASEYSGGCTPHQREAAHYERGRKAGLAQALELVDAEEIAVAASARASRSAAVAGGSGGSP
jgi:hypothetical protein